MNAPKRISLASVSSLVAALALSGACAVPPQADALDKFNCPSDGGPCTEAPAPGVVQGAVVYQGPRRGDVVLLLFASNSLPPPDGTATAPVEIGRVSAAALFAGAAPGSSGPFSAPYLLTEVPPGNYQIRAFIDLGGDFDPFADFTQSPHAGAPTGGTVTFDANGAPQLANFTVAANTVVTEQVIIGQEVPFDPPAFQLAAGQPSTFPQNIDRPQALVLQAFNPGVPHANFTAPKFTLQLHPSASGQPQESDGDGLLDIYPQITLLQTQALQNDGTLLAVHGADAAIVPCKVLPIATWPLFAAHPTGAFGVDQITVLIEPLAVKLSATGAAVPLPGIPAGQYELVIAERTGQVWTLPNSLGAASADSGFHVASQATSITFSSVVPPGGAITGLVHYPANRTPHNLIIQAFKGGPALAPPLAAQLPARVLSVPGRFITLTAQHTFAYSLEGLTPGTYVVEALDDGDGNFNNLDILQTPTRGDLIGGILDAHGNLATLTVGSGTLANEDVVLVSAPGQDGQGNGVPLDPPAFVLDESAGPAQLTQDARGTVRVNVKAKPDPFPALSQQAATTLFTVALVRDAAGNPVDSDGDGLPDIWPRAFLLEIDPADPQGLALASPTVALPAAVDPTPFLPALLAGGANAVLPATQLSIIVRPTAVDLTNPAAPARLPVMPAGKYKLILMNKTGQFWQLPNSSGTAALDPRAALLSDTASQSRAFAVLPPAHAVPAGEIDGTLTLSGITSFSSAYLFAYSVESPPPPLGTGKPISVDFHSAAEFATAGTSKTVSFALRGLPKDSYFVTAIVDARGDFAVDPFLFAAAPGPGSFAGGVLDATFHLKPIPVVSSAVTGVAALVPSANVLPVRPSFVLSEGNAAVTADLTTLFPDALTPQRLTLAAQTVLGNTVAALAPESGPAFFPVSYQACSAADPTRGADADFDNLPDLYPRVLVVRLADSDPSGLTIDPADIAIPAAIDPTPLLARLGSCAAGNVATVGSLSVILQPIAVQQHSDGSFSQLPIPAGRYGVIVESSSGQVWRIPNELQPSLLDPRSAATSAGQVLAAQGVGIRVGAQVPPALGGGITGTVSLVNESAASIGNLIVAAYAADAPPPPLGLGRPLAVQVTPRPYVEQAFALGRPLSYLLANLPSSGEGAYLVLAMNDAADEFSPSLDVMSTPPFGAQLSFAGGAVPTPIVVGDTIVSAPAITLDGASLTSTIPFQRPAFAPSSAALSVSSSTANSFSVVALTPVDPDGLAYPVPATPAFHPTLARNSSGQPYRDPLSPACGANQPWASSAVYAAPIDTGERFVAYVQLNSCQFCPSLTGSADCSSAPLQIPLPMTTPIQAVVTNVAIDPLTERPAGIALPPGHYALTLIESTGQSWTVPNALSEAPSSSGVAQGTVFTVLP